VAASLIVGLRNPGSDYEGTRHNLGAEVVSAMAPGEPLKRAPRHIRADLAKVPFEGIPAILAVPRTFMNHSGDAVQPLSRYFGLDGDDLLVIHDDIDLPFGKVRLQFGGGEGGHNGVRSVVRSMGSEEFWRLKIGVGRPPARIDPADYVLQRFGKVERDAMDGIVIRAAQIAELFVTAGGEAARQRAGEINAD
jgi:peptidyl-tRNA hydrolase, PTH1 family